jgi:hypothetical protein
MTRQTLIQLIAVSVVGAALALTAHIILQQWAQPIISVRMSGVEVARPPYGALITAMAYSTAIVPAFVAAVLFYYGGHLLPAHSRLAKGMWLALFILLVKGDLVRQPIMNALIGNPPTVVVLSDLHILAANLALGIVIGLFGPVKNAAG